MVSSVAPHAVHVFLRTLDHCWKVTCVCLLVCQHSHDHQLNWWHDFDPIRVFYQPRLKTHEDLPTAFLSQAAAKAALFFAAEILFPRKRIIVFLHRHLIVAYVFSQLIPYILCNRLLISADCIHIVSSTPEMTIPISIL